MKKALSVKPILLCLAAGLIISLLIGQLVTMTHDTRNKQLLCTGANVATTSDDFGCPDLVIKKDTQGLPLPFITNTHKMDGYLLQGDDVGQKISPLAFIGDVIVWSAATFGLYLVWRRYRGGVSSPKRVKLR